MEDSNYIEISPNFKFHTLVFSVLISFSSEDWQLKIEMWLLKSIPLATFVAREEFLLDTAALNEILGQYAYFFKRVDF